ncbi:MAG: DnaJ C-terminal domain-containing protein [Alphaproteobacteria bacterium]
MHNIMQNPYQVLGLGKDASESDIKKTYRRLAKKFHPDANTKGSGNEKRFAQVSAAYDLLKDNERRGKFDRGEIDADGKPTGFAGAGFRHPRGPGGSPFGGGFNAEDIFSEIFGNQRGGRGRFTAPGQDVNYSLSVPFLDAARGATKRITLTGGKTLDVKIPKAMASGQQIRLRGQGATGPGGMAGDAIITVEVEPHALFEREGNNLKLTLPITLYEAVLGEKVRVPTVDGSVELKIPSNSSSGRVLRLKSKGLVPETGAPGDLFVSLRIVLPESDLDLETFLRRRSITKPYSVRGPQFD